MKIGWPNGHSFALTICDDTDEGTLGNLRHVYDALFEAGLRTTKTVWCLPCVAGARIQGQTLSENDYCAWIRDLSDKGFEIAWHGARSGGASRSEVERGLQMFHDLLGSWPRTYANHSTNLENIYWGAERFDNPLLKLLYRRIRSDHPVFLGSSPQSGYFWGDLCLKRIKYVRDFTFNDIATTNVDPNMPYYDPRRPHVRAWFSSSDGAVVDKFVNLLTPENLDRLERKGAACIVYTHFAAGFVADGRVDARVQRILTDVAQRNGWYVPVSELLQFLEERRGISTISRLQRFQLEARWAFEHFGPAVTHIFGSKPFGSRTS